jgi:hypothetical protein
VAPVVVCWIGLLSSGPIQAVNLSLISGMLYSLSLSLSFVSIFTLPGFQNVCFITCFTSLVFSYSSEFFFFDRMHLFHCLDTSFFIGFGDFIHCLFHAEARAFTFFAEFCPSFIVMMASLRNSNLMVVRQSEHVMSGC